MVFVEYVDSKNIDVSGVLNAARKNKSQNQRNAKIQNPNLDPLRATEPEFEPLI